MNDVPLAGDILDSTDEKIARSVAEKRVAKNVLKKFSRIPKFRWMICSNVFKRARLKT